MGIKASRQSPAVLQASHTIATDGVYDPVGAVREVLITPILGSASGNPGVTLTDADGHDVSDQFETWMLDCMSGIVETEAESRVQEVLGQRLAHFEASTGLRTEELFAIQAGTRLGLPAPGEKVLYSPGGDVQPAAKALTADSGEADAFFTSLAYTYHPDTLGFWFRNEAAYTEFAQWLRAQSQIPGLPAITKKLLRDTADLPMNRLTQALALRKDEHNGNGEGSYARVVVHLLMTWTKQQAGGDPTAGVLPFSLSKLFIPTSIVLVNAAAHAEATPGRIGKEWRIINEGLSSPVRVIPHDQLAKLDALPRAAARVQVEAVERTVPGTPGSRSTRLKLRKTPPTQIELASDLAAIVKRMDKVNHSQNVLLTSKPSFRKASRRDPDDINRPGRIASKQYLPDLHAYLDVSMSISEENYQEAVMTLIIAAKKLGVNLYFNSFSHVLSDESLLRTKGRTPGQVWKRFSAIPKVSGGTEFSQIWHYINASPVRRRRLSLVVTDFQWEPPSLRLDHPPHLYYAPCGKKDWDDICHWAKNFTSTMAHIDPTVGTHLLGMYR